MGNIWGANFFGHDSSLCVLQNSNVIWHKGCEGYFLNENLVSEALEFGYPDLICYYEIPWLKKTRQLFSLDFSNALSLYNPRLHFYELGIYSPIKYFEHHQSHAAAGYFLSNFKDSIILVIDAIGEWETFTIWLAKENKMKKLFSKNYPYSLGLFYSAFTKYLGYLPLREENKLMQLSLLGDANKHYDKIKKYLKRNLHKGVKDILPGRKEDIAASVQKIFEDEIIENLYPYKNLSKNIVFTGGCANNKIVCDKLKSSYNDLYVPKNPGDFYSSIGAAFCHLKLENKK